VVSGAANYIGSCDVIVDHVLADGSCGLGLPVIGSEIMSKIAASNLIYALLEAKGAYTPASAEVFTLTLENIQE
jgi:hypothetical protein